MDSTDFERVLLVKPDVHVFKIPPRVTNRAYRASDWNLDSPDWNCRLRLISKGDECYIKLDEKSTGQFFGKCPIDKYPDHSIEPVSDSSRYFVLRLVNEQTGRSASVGIGFVDRSDSFDLNVALQDHFKILKLENTLLNEDDAPKLDLKFKEGETIKVNLNIGTKTSSSKPKTTNPLNKGMGILLPPPPSSKSTSTAAPVSNQKATEHSGTETVKSVSDSFDLLQISLNGPEMDKNLNKKKENDWVDFADMPKSIPNTTIKEIDNDNVKNQDHFQSADLDLWSDFSSCNTNNTNKTTLNSNANQFDDWAKFS